MQEGQDWHPASRAGTKQMAKSLEFELGVSGVWEAGAIPATTWPVDNLCIS